MPVTVYSKQSFVTKKAIIDVKYDFNVNSLPYFVKRNKLYYGNVESKFFLDHLVSLYFLIADIT